jgi:hypothetical protein
MSHFPLTYCRRIKEGAEKKDEEKFKKMRGKIALIASMIASQNIL